MQDLTVKQLQDYLEHKYQATGITESLFMKLIEEVGEVAEVLNQIKGRKQVTTNHTLGDELVDVIHYAVAIAAINGIDLTETIITKDKQASLKYHQTPNLEEFLLETK